MRRQRHPQLPLCSDQKIIHPFLYSLPCAVICSPSSFGIFVGNKVAVEKVERWLIEWKLASKKSGHKDYVSVRGEYERRRTLMAPNVHAIAVVKPGSY